MPTRAEEEKLDGKPLGLLIESSPATVERIIAYAVHNSATRRPVGQYLNNALRVLYILPIADIERADNRAVTLGGVRRVRDLLIGDHEKKNGDYCADPESDSASQTCCYSSRAW
jgi:hypothetical protein